MQRIFILAFVVFISAQAVCADIVHLKSGQSVEGIVLEETDNEVRVDLGFGFTTFDRENVSDVEKKPFEKKKILPNGTSDPNVPTEIDAIKELNHLVNTIRMKRRIVSRYHATLMNRTKKLENAQKKLIPFLTENLM